MKKKIALVYGGDSSEVEISVQSGKNVSSYISRERYDVYEVFLRGASWKVQLYGKDGGEAISQVEVDKTDFSFTYNGVKVKFDFAYIMIHGTPGENGLLQGYFEMLGVPFSTCSSFVSAITFDKHSCKRFLDFAGVKMAKDVFLREGHEYSVNSIVKELGLPLFVKPTNGGSSFGITKVKREEELDQAIKSAFKECNSIIIEECITGREMTNGIYRKNGEVVTLPVTEIVTNREFFDYEAKYLGMSNEICPAPISDELTKDIQELTAKIYKYMGCDGLVRIDYIVKGYDIYFLEINTIPGMTAMSLVPAQVRAAGIDMGDFFTALIEEADKR
ncbi:MAG: D-alanine--D-alanine ligase [Bacteroidales bacterium]|nr:D-alanine--D-alanine ligase [Bacteroidales bacterium]